MSRTSASPMSAACYSKPRVALATALIWTSLGTARCKSVPDHAGVKEAAGTAQSHGLDVNDVSFLLPLPPTAAALGTMIGLDSLRSDGTPLVSKALFTDILGHFKYTATIAGEKVNLNAGASFKGVHNAVANGGPFDDYNGWKVVAMRYDPCAPLAGQKIAPGAQRSMPTAFAAGVCSPQMRLTIQPLVPRAHAGFALAAGRNDGSVDFPTAGDYAIHLIFALDGQDSEHFYHDLVAFRDSCGDVTSGFPLSIQPCLLAEKNAGRPAGPHAQALAALVHRYAKTLAGLAAMATRDGGDPWTFMNGTVAGDQFVHTPIDAVAKDKDIKRNAQGKMLESFHNGYYQQVDFLSVATRSDDGSITSSTNPNGNRVTPHAVDGKVTASLLGEFNGELGAQQAFLVKVNRLQNPLFNHFLTTDCASCHGASDVGYRFVDAPNSDLGGQPGGENRSGGGFIVPDNSLAGGSPAGQDAERAGDFYKSEGYTNVVDGHSLASSAGAAGTSKPYGFIHFGYFGVSGSVSQRAANESAMAAKLANQYYAGGLAPKAACAAEPLRSCLGDRLLWWWARRDQSFDADTFTNLHLYAIERCMRKVCATRATELKDVFGSHHLKKLAAKHDIAVNLSLPGELVLAKDTVVEGLILQDIWGGNNLTAADLIPLKSPDGSVHYGVRSLQLQEDPSAALEER